MSKIPLSRFRTAFLVTAALSNLAVLYGQTGATQRGVQDVTPTSSSSSSPTPIGPYYALVIGNNDYKELNKLQTAVGDAEALAQLLHIRFGFETQVLTDATRAKILDALDDYQRSLPERSNLLIYYAGHGYKDVAAHRAYWLPVDAQRDHSPNWINAVEITDKLRAIPSRHILVIADSCWSGDLTMRSASAGITSYEHNAVLIRSLMLKSRHIMSSGGDEPVADGGGNGHSVFTGALLQSLNDMEGDSFTAEALHSQRIKPRVAGRSQQTPEYAIVRDSDADLGDFVFFRSRNTVNGTAPGPRPQKKPDEPVQPLRSQKGTLSELLNDLPASSFAGGYEQYSWLEDRRGEILRRTKTLFVDVPKLLLVPDGSLVTNDKLRETLANQAYKMLHIQLADDRKNADVVLVVEARNMSNPVSEFFVKPDDNIIFRLNVDDKNFYTTYSSVLKGRSSREQTDNLAREVVRFLQEVRAVPWSADK